MGSQVIAKCKCGVEATSFVGSNMSNFKTTQYFPVLCKGCFQVVQVNARSDTPQCPECNSYNVTLYNDTSLIGTPGNKTAVQSFNLELSDGTYKCPGCDEYSLRFFSTGLLFD